MFHVKNIEENIDFILTFLPNDFVNFISNQITLTLTNSESNANKYFNFLLYNVYHKQLCHYDMTMALLLMCSRLDVTINCKKCFIAHLLY